MNKNGFAESFKQKLYMLPHGEVEKSLLFYTEIIDDRVEDGMSEEEAVAALGDINEIVHEIMLTVPLSSLVKAKMKPKHKLSTWEIVLIIVGFPLWFPLLAAFFMVFLSVYITIWSIILALYAFVASFGLTAIACIILSILVIAQNPVSGVFQIGCAAISIGLGIFAFIAVKNLSVWLINLTKLFLRSVKTFFINKQTEGDTTDEIA